MYEVAVIENNVLSINPISVYALIHFAFRKFYEKRLIILYREKILLDAICRFILQHSQKQGENSKVYHDNDVIGIYYLTTNS